MSWSSGRTNREIGCLTNAPPIHAEHLGGSEIRFQNQPLLAEGDIAHRRQIVEVEIARSSGLQLHLGPAQFIVLHLQLDLVHPQFMERLPRFFGR